MYPFPHYGDFTAFTPVVPELYWNVYSAEERIKALCLEWVKLVAFTDAMVDTVNEQYAEITDDIQARYDALDAAVKNIQDIVNDMQTRLPQLVNDDVVTEIRRLINDGEFAEMLQAAIDEYWAAYEQRIVGVETGLQTLNGELTTERDARIAEDAQIRSNFADDIASVNETLSTDVARLELQDEQINARITEYEKYYHVRTGELNRRYIKIRPVSDNDYDISIPAGYYTQGATIDSNGFVYVVVIANDNSASELRKYAYSDSTFLLLNVLALPDDCHGNTLAYDSVNDTIILFYKNDSFMIIDCPTFTIKGSTPSYGSAKNGVSGIGLNDAWGVFNITSSNSYMLMRRIDDVLFSWGKIDTLPTGITSLRQDCVIYNNVFYQMFSGRGIHSFLRAFSVGGTQTADFIITYVTDVNGDNPEIFETNVEFEGIWVKNDVMFMITANGKVYTCPMTGASDEISSVTVFSATQPNPNIAFFENLQVPSATNYDKYNNAWRAIPVVASGKTSYITVLLPVSPAAVYARQNAIKIVAFGINGYAAPGTGAAFGGTIVNASLGTIINVQYAQGSNNSSFANRLYLSAISIYKLSDNTRISVSLNEADMTSDYGLSKLTTFMESAISGGYVGNTPGNIYVAGYGDSPVYDNLLTMVNIRA